MLSKLLKVLFVPKPARARPRAKESRTGRAAPREKLLSDAMAVYRQQRQEVYDSLDEDTKRQIEADAEKAFGKVLRPKG